MKKPYREGYFKNEEEERAALAGMFAEHREANERLAVLEDKLHRIAVGMQEIATHFRTGSVDDFDVCTLLPLGELEALVADIKITGRERDRLASLLYETKYKNLL